MRFLARMRNWEFRQLPLGAVRWWQLVAAGVQQQFCFEKHVASLGLLTDDVHSESLLFSLY